MRIAFRSLYSVVVINQPGKNNNNQHQVDKILEECSIRKRKDQWKVNDE
jgi:hypothetical protein